MHSLIVLALLPLALAHSLSKGFILLPRQGSDAFTPSTSGYEYDCKNPCGKDCVHPEKGETCCAEGYGCPSDSFCLTKGYCCPTGDDPATCASKRGITLPNGFKAGQTVASFLSSSTTAPASPSPTTVVPSPSTTPASETPVVTSSPPAPYPTPVTNATLPPPSTATGTGTPGGSPVPFTGGAMRFAIDGVIAAIVFAAVGLLM